MHAESVWALCDGWLVALFVFVGMSVTFFPCTNDIPLRGGLSPKLTGLHNVMGGWLPYFVFVGISETLFPCTPRSRPPTPLTPTYPRHFGTNHTTTATLYQVEMQVIK